MRGSKIENLQKLIEKSFNVPDFIVLEGNKYFDKNTGLLKENISLQLEEGLYAVRSSSNLEDGKNDSFAGQFSTYLNVPLDQLESKVEECFKSLYNANVLDYVKEKGIEFNDLEMNVIIQKMVQSELSGVLFTGNPQGILNESVIVVGKGLGEGVVSDQVETTAYYYNTTDSIYYYEGSEPLLTHEKVEQLIALSKQISEIIGKYIDIEFGIVSDEIYILQVRLITTLSEDNMLIFDNSNIVESYPGISLPISVSFVDMVYSGVFEGLSRRVLKNEKVLAKHKEVFRNMVGATNGRIYYKISNWYTVIKFLPFNSKIIPVWQEMLGVSIKSYDKEKVEMPFFTKIMTYFNTISELINTPKNMKKLEKKFWQVNNDFYERIYKCQNEDELWQLFYKTKDELLSCWDITLLNDVYTFAFTGLLKHRLKKKYANHEEYANKYISGISNIESLKPIKAMIKLAYEKDSLTASEYEKRFNEYIERYGDRNLEELKLESPTFRTNHQILTNRIDEYRQDKDKLENMYQQMFAENAASKEYEKEDALTRFLIKRCMVGIGGREISRLNRSRIYGMIREMVLCLAKLFTKKGLIDDESDIFYLSFEEMENTLKYGPDYKKLISTRKEKYKLYKLLPAYSRIIFDEKAFDKNHVSVGSQILKQNESQLQGVPCSNGEIEGEALVVTDVSAVKNVKDKILITKMTDPGWVFLLATAKGVIAEKGSLLSHTAIISRELKIPSIVGVSKLMDSINSGDKIRMNGTTGEIEILSRA